MVVHGKATLPIIENPQIADGAFQVLGGEAQQKHRNILAIEPALNT